MILILNFRSLHVFIYIVPFRVVNVCEIHMNCELLEFHPTLFWACDYFYETKFGNFICKTAPILPCRTRGVSRFNSMIVRASAVGFTSIIYNLNTSHCQHGYQLNTAVMVVWQGLIDSDLLCKCITCHKCAHGFVVLEHNSWDFFYFKCFHPWVSLT